MTMRPTALAAAVLLALSPGLAGAQTTTQTKVDHDTSMKDGVATHKTTTTHTVKRKTHEPRKVLGVTVGHKTATSRTVRTTKVSSDGDSSTTVKTTN